jgi:hypothetical protein
LSAIGLLNEACAETILKTDLPFSPLHSRATFPSPSFLLSFPVSLTGMKGGFLKAPPASDAVPSPMLKTIKERRISMIERMGEHEACDTLPPKNRNDIGLDD